MFSILGLILSLIIIMYLAYKGYSTIITAPIIAIITIILTTGFNGHLMANYTEVYMSGFANFIKNYFPLFMTGAIFAKLMEEANYAKSIAHFITQKLGKDKSILAVVLSGALLTYGGVSLFVVAFILYPIASMLFKEADIPKRLIPGTIALGAFTFTMTAAPGSPEIQNVIPMKYFGTDAFAAPLLGIIASLLMLGLGMIYLSREAKKARNNNEGYGDYIENEKLTEEKLYQQISIILSLLIQMIEIAFEQNNEYAYNYYAKVYKQVGKCFDLANYLPYLGILQVAILKRDEKTSISILKKLFTVLFENENFLTSPLYSHLTIKANKQKLVKEAKDLLSTLLKDKDFDFLKENEDFIQMLKRI